MVKDLFRMMFCEMLLQSGGPDRLQQNLQLAICMITANPFT